MLYADYAETEKGYALNKLFHDYKLKAVDSSGTWWAANALSYCAMMELWDFLSDDNGFEIDESAQSVTPQALFYGFLKWAHAHPNIGITMTQDYGDSRYEVLKNAFRETWR